MGAKADNLPFKPDVTTPEWDAEIENGLTVDELREKLTGLDGRKLVFVCGWDRKLKAAGDVIDPPESNSIMIVPWDTKPHTPGTND